MSTTPQTEALLKAPPIDIKLSSEIPNVPFIHQSSGHCGPATLAMLMNWNGHLVSVDELVKQVYTLGMKGSLQSDMISAIRRNSLMAVQIQGLAALLKEVSAGHPVIVFENLALSWAPQYHYAVVYGYNLEKKQIIMHSGPEAGKHVDLRKFERSWVLGDYWGLVVLPAGKLAATGTELAHVTAAAGLEQLKKTTAAEKSYLAILERWPHSLGALIGLGNIEYAHGNYFKSTHYLRLAVARHPQSTPAQHNLVIAEKALVLEQKNRDLN